ncbi:hypothetical protein BKA81DRAFT_213810 [Phyllosticta paracitricarpa]|uniref:Secreted protein n=1 Tax=Phyllosticta paracitricarpa TaxID=2016321 RepID=A0ABR1MT05_9PEZI
MPAVVGIFFFFFLFSAAVNAGREQPVWLIEAIAGAGQPPRFRKPITHPFVPSRLYLILTNHLPALRNTTPSAVPSEKPPALSHRQRLTYSMQSPSPLAHFASTSHRKHVEPFRPAQGPPPARPGDAERTSKSVLLPGAPSLPLIVMSFQIRDNGLCS